MNAQLKLLHPILIERFNSGKFNPATPLSAGIDLVACIDQSITLERGSPAVLIPTGFALFTNERSVTGLILPRSGKGHKEGLVLGNSVGLIDGDYQNQWFVSAWNRGQKESITINPGDEIAQMVFVPIIHPQFEVVSEFSDETQRGLGGFGSTTEKTSQ